MDEMYIHVYFCVSCDSQSLVVAFGHPFREIMLFIGKKPKGRSIMISNATNPLKESREDLY